VCLSVLIASSVSLAQAENRDRGAKAAPDIPGPVAIWRLFHSPAPSPGPPGSWSYSWARGRSGMGGPICGRGAWTADTRNPGDRFRSPGWCILRTSHIGGPRFT